MNVLGKREIVSVQLFNVEISESELDTYRRLLLYALNNLKAEEIERLFGDKPEELEGLLDDIENALEEAGLLSEEKNQKPMSPPKARSDEPRARTSVSQY